MKLRRLLAPALAAVLLSACGAAAPGTGGAATGTALRPVTLVLDWYPNGDHAGIYSAKAQGYDQAAGIDLRVQVPADPSTALRSVAAGQADFAVSYEPEVFLSRAQGIPVQAVMAIVQRPLNAIIALQSSGIARPRDLKGKKVGTDGLASTQALLDTVLRADGVQPSQVTTVNVSEDNVAALLAHKVDAIVGAYWNWEAVQIQLQGQPVNVMRLEQWGVPTYDELVFVTSDQEVRDHPDVVRAFVAAMVRGEQYAKDHPDGAVAALLAASKDLQRDLVSRSVQLLQPVWQDDAPAIGYMDPTQWGRYEQWMRAQGLLPHDVPVDQAMTDRFLPGGGG